MNANSVPTDHAHFTPSQPTECCQCLFTTGLINSELRAPTAACEVTHAITCSTCTTATLLVCRPRKDERLSWPSWLTCSGRFTHISGHPSAAGRAQHRESSPVRDRCSTTVPHHQLPRFLKKVFRFLRYFFRFLYEDRRHEKQTVYLNTVSY